MPVSRYIKFYLLSDLFSIITKYRNFYMMAIYVIFMLNIIHFGEEYDVFGKERQRERKITFNPKENQFS